MDNEGQNEDIQIFIDDTGVYIRQWNDILEFYNLICFSHEMYNEMQVAMDQGEGLFKVEE